MSIRNQEQEVLGWAQLLGWEELSLGLSSLWGGSAWGPCTGLSPVSTRRNLSSAPRPLPPENGVPRAGRTHGHLYINHA